MKALQLVAPATLALTDILVPAITSSDVPVRVTDAGVCQTDGHIRSGQQGRVFIGLVLGHEIAGEIAAVGDGVSGWLDDHKVVVHPCWSCGVSAVCGRSAHLPASRRDRRSSSVHPHLHGSASSRSAGPLG